MKHPEINEILNSYTAGEIDFGTANKQLDKANSKVYLNPEKNVISDEERYTHGLLDTGTGSLDKVEIKDMHLANMDCGEMYALCIFNGKTYKVNGTELVEE